jgi:predicted deacetylase
MQKKNYFTVSIHDVDKNDIDAIKYFVEDLKPLGITKFNLVTIPNEEKNNPIDKAPELIKWLHEMERNGSQIVVHGLYHKDYYGKYNTICQKIVGKYIFHGYSEFISLPYDLAYKYMKESIKIFKKCNLPTDTFLPPAWGISKDAIKAWKDLGGKRVIEFFAINDFENNKEFFSPTLGIESQKLWLHYAWRIYDWFMFYFDKYSHHLAKFTLHPGDQKNLNGYKNMKKLMAKAIKKRELVTIDEFIKIKKNKISKCCRF